MNVLITGAAGFIGGYLSNYCSQAGHSVLGIGISEPEALSPGASFEHCDVRDAGRLNRLIATFRPERVFHLAAQSYPTVSLLKPAETFDINAGGTINLFEGLRQAALSPVVVVACSSAEYGLVAARDVPVRETHPLRPLHPYGVSKVAQDLMAAQYFDNYSIPSVRIRIFNTTGPGKTGDVCSDLTRRAIEIELGLRQSPLTVGNLTTRRALIDVRDMVRALWLSSEHGAPGDVYNVGGSTLYSAQDLIDAIRQRVATPFSVSQDPSLVRGCDEPVIWGDVSKFQGRCNWTPQIDILNTLGDMLAWWKMRLGREAVASKGHSL